MSVCVSAGDCARHLIAAVEAKVENATHRGNWEGKRIGVPIMVPMDLYRENSGQTWCVLEVPGAKRESINVHLNESQNLLTMCGFLEKSSPLEKDGDFLHREGRYGHFIREVQVPRDTKGSQIKAKYNNGILLVEIPESKGSKGGVQVQA